MAADLRCNGAHYNCVSSAACKQPNCQQEHPANRLHAKAQSWGLKVTDLSFARKMDEEDPLKDFRSRFHIPKKGTLPEVDFSLVHKDDDCVYFCGNSLGLQPKGVRQKIDKELEKWANMGVHGHVHGDLPWAFCDEKVDAQNAVLVGAKREEVAVMNGLTVNLHLLMISFYRPTPQRHKILLESKAFPSDHYMVESQILLHGYDPKTSMICMEPRKGEHLLRHEDILDTIEREGDSIAVIMFPGVQYYTGQTFDMAAITKAGQAKGCYVGLDLAHAVGNVEIHLHDWGVDFAAWCTYKYLNGSAGCIAGAFIHEQHMDANLPKLTGWWGHRIDSRFQMDNNFEPSAGISSYRISNPPGLLCAPLQASMDVFMDTSMADLCAKSQLLTGYLELLLHHYFPRPETPTESCKPWIEIITPADINSRGCQLSVSFSVPITRVFVELKKRGVALDKREPSVLRLAPTPLYNSFEDVHCFIELLEQSLEAAKTC